MATRNLVVIASSAGGVEALSFLIPALPRDLPASVFVVQHMPPQRATLLPRLLARAGGLPVSVPSDGERFLPGHVYFSRPHYHLLIEDSVMRVTRDPRENGHRPSADALFRTAALFAIKQRGGFAVVQDPEKDFCPDMPRNAMEHTQVDAVCTLEQIAARLSGWTRAKHALRKSKPKGAHTDRLEAALWAALRALEQQADLSRRTAKARDVNRPKSAAWHEVRASSAAKQADVVREELGLGPRKLR